MIKVKKLGIEQGEKYKAIEIAKQLLKNKIDIEIICDSTGLTEDEINAIE